MFIVMVEENSHYMAEEERRTYGEYPSYVEAIHAVKDIIRHSLTELHTPGMEAGKLFELYKTMGQDAFIVPDDEPRPFSAREYAHDRCKELCGPGCAL